VVEAVERSFEDLKGLFGSVRLPPPAIVSSSKAAAKASLAANMRSEPFSLCARTLYNPAVVERDRGTDSRQLLRAISKQHSRHFYHKVDVSAHLSQSDRPVKHVFRR